MVATTLGSRIVRGESARRSPAQCRLSAARTSGRGDRSELARGRLARSAQPSSARGGPRSRRDDSGIAGGPTAPALRGLRARAWRACAAAAPSFFFFFHPQRCGADCAALPPATSPRAAVLGGFSGDLGLGHRSLSPPGSATTHGLLRLHNAPRPRCATSASADSGAPAGSEGGCPASPGGRRAYPSPTATCRGATRAIAPAMVALRHGSDRPSRHQAGKADDVQRRKRWWGAPQESGALATDGTYGRVKCETLPRHRAQANDHHRRPPTPAAALAWAARTCKRAGPCLWAVRARSSMTDSLGRRLTQKLNRPGHPTSRTKTGAVGHIPL